MQFPPYPHADACFPTIITSVARSPGTNHARLQGGERFTLGNKHTSTRTNGERKSKTAMSIWTRRFQRLSLGDPEYTPAKRRWVTDGNEHTSAESRRLGTKVMMSRIHVEETKMSVSNRSQLDQRGRRTVVARPPPPALRRESRRTGRPRRNGRGRRRGRTRTHEGPAQKRPVRLHKPLV